MPTIVGILTFISRINTTYERLKARIFFICRYFSFDEQLNFHAQLSWAQKMFYNLGPCHNTNDKGNLSNQFAANVNQIAHK